MQFTDTDTSEYAALIEFAATSGRVRSHPVVDQNADKLISSFLRARADAMTQALAAVAKAAARKAA